jgi:hypothetical protein
LVDCGWMSSFVLFLTFSQFTCTSHSTCQKQDDWYEHFCFDWQVFIYPILVPGWLFWRKNYQFCLKRETKYPERTSRSNRWLVPLFMSVFCKRKTGVSCTTSRTWTSLGATSWQKFGLFWSYQKMPMKVFLSDPIFKKIIIFKKI